MVILALVFVSYNWPLYIFLFLFFNFHPKPNTTLTMPKLIKEIDPFDAHDINLVLKLDDTRAVVVINNCRIVVVNILTYEVTMSEPFVNMITDAVIVKGNVVAISPTSLFVVNPDNFEVVHNMEDMHLNHSCIAYSEPHDLLAIGSRHKCVTFFDSSTFAQVADLNVGHYVEMMQFLSDGKLVTGESLTRIVHVWNKPCLSSDGNWKMPLWAIYDDIKANVMFICVMAGDTLIVGDLREQFEIINTSNGNRVTWLSKVVGPDRLGIVGVNERIFADVHTGFVKLRDIKDRKDESEIENGRYNASVCMLSENVILIGCDSNGAKPCKLQIVDLSDDLL